MPDILLHLLPHIVTVFMYGALGIHFLRTRWSKTNEADVSLPMSLRERWTIFLALLIHGIALYDGILGQPIMRFSVGLALSLMMWLAVLIYWLENFRSRMEGLQPMALLLASACAALPVVFPGVREIPHAAELGFKFHFLASMSAYALFTLSALHAVFMGFAERKLHQRTLTRRLTGLPPLLTMEALLFKVITIGFILLSISLGSGIFYSEHMFGKPFRFDHKTLFAFTSWGIFAGLLAGRYFYGWRGKTALRLTLAGFFVLILAYIGVRFAIEMTPSPHLDTSHALSIVYELA